jgi:hypothetical protein
MSKEKRSTGDEKITTTDAGIPVSSDEFSLTVGPDGPILLQDHYLIQKMAQTEATMKRGRIRAGAILFLVCIGLSLSACTVRPGYYRGYPYDPGYGWYRGWGGWHHGWDRSHWDHGGWGDGFAHGGLGGHGGFGGHGGGGHR